MKGVGRTSIRSSQVATTAGFVDGFVRDGVVRWRSIPFAQAPRGPLRFRAPRPAAPWRGLRHCYEFSTCAPQLAAFATVRLRQRQLMSEDCLSLNVVAPAAMGDELLPVMLFIHGGGYVVGTSAMALYDGAPLARRGCIFISVNYRLGALGCLDLSALSTSDDVIESNLYLRDLVAALEWVRDNIVAFGGDPDNVTIFGESAGAHAVSTLLAVPAASGLFHRAICQSAPARMTRTETAAAELAHSFVGVLGLQPQDVTIALRSASPVVLVSALSELMKRTLRDRPCHFPVGATVDGDYLPCDPLDAMATGAAHPVPLIVGHNSYESALFSAFGRFMPTSVSTIERLLDVTQYGDRENFHRAYPGYPDRATCMKICSDVVFGAMAWRIAEAHSQYAATYLYRYDYAPRPLSWCGLGATHATELLALFDAYRHWPGSALTVAGDRGQTMAVASDLRRRWLEFGRVGVPGADWPTITQDEPAVRIWARRSRFEVDPTPQRRQAWEHISLSA